jgi:hypothetical protein
MPKNRFNRINQIATSSTKYCPELDISPELEAEEASYFQLIIGMLRWIVELDE